MDKTKSVGIANSCIKLCEEMMESTKKISGNVSTVFYQGILIYFLVRSKRALESIILLAEKGYVDQAYILARSLVEMSITAEYISKEPDKRSSLFLGYSNIQRKKLHDSVSKWDSSGQVSADSPRGARELLADYDKVKTDYPDERYWAGKGMSIYNIAKEIGATLIYKNVYVFLSNKAHNAPLCMNDYFSEGTNGEYIIKDCFNNDKYFNEAILGPCVFLLHIQNLYNDAFRFNSQKQLDELKEKLGKGGDK